MNRIVKELPPVKYNNLDNGYEIKVWNRRYLLENSPFLVSIMSGNKELLAEPMRIVGVENGKELTFEQCKTFKIEEERETSVQFCQAVQSERFIFNINLKVEYDGVMDWELTIVPRGYSIAQLFGFEDVKKEGYVLSKLWIEIPLKKEFIKYYQCYPSGEIYLDGEKADGDQRIAMAGDFPDRNIQIPFKQQIYLGDDSGGVAAFFESDENWQYEDKNKAIEAYSEEDKVVLRLHILDSDPKYWEEKGTDNGILLLPISYRFGMQVTPVKPYPSNPYKEKNVHIDCYKKIFEDYEDYLLRPIDSSGEIVLDRIKRLGVNTLYIHEKWNDIQNSPILTDKTSKRLKLIVEESHKRGIKVIPYFGYEISTLSPIFEKYGKIYKNSDTEKHYHGQWYRQPAQRALKVCYNSDFQDVFVKGIEKLICQYDFDGLYLDGMLTPWECLNEKHGCGYRDEEGILHTTYPTWAIRETIKRLYEIVNRRGGIINVHPTGAFPVYAFAYVDSIWDGEVIQEPLLHGRIDEVPEGHFSVMYSGRNVGVPCYMLCYSNPEKWPFTKALSTTLPLGVLPKPVDVGAPLEEMNKVWKVVDSFPVDNSVWNPYHSNGLRTSNISVKVSYYRCDNKYLFFISNYSNKNIENVTVQLPEHCNSLKNALTDEKILVKDNKIEISAEGFSYLIAITNNL